MKNIFFEIAYRLGILALFDRVNKKALRVYSYHAVVDNDAQMVSGMDFRTEVLRSQMILLSNRYVVQRLDRLLEGSKPGVAVTFDDGCATDFTKVKPILDSLGIKGTFFVCADLAEGLQPLTWCDQAFLVGLSKSNPRRRIQKSDRQAAFDYASIFENNVRVKRETAPLTLLMKNMTLKQEHDYHAALELGGERCSSLQQAELRVLNDTGHLIGCHTATHPVLKHLEHSASDLEEEIIESRTRISALIGAEIEYFAYPFGEKRDVSEPVVAFVKNSGFKAAFLNEIGENSSRFEIGRQSLPHTENPAELFSHTSGFVYFLKTGKLLPAHPVSNQQG